MSKCNAATMRSLLREKFGDTRRYAVAEEVGNSTGLSQRRRLDMVVVDVYQSNGFSIEGIEIKVSKADLRKELQDSSKHNVFFDDLDYYSLAAPREVIDKDIIPKHWGIYAADFGADGEWRLVTIRKPLSLHDTRLSHINRGFFACLSRALSCQSPTAKRVEEARKAGVEEGRKKYECELALRARRVNENAARLNELERLFDKCRTWGEGSVDRGVKRFEAKRGRR